MDQCDRFGACASDEKKRPKGGFGENGRAFSGAFNWALEEFTTKLFASHSGTRVVGGWFLVYSVAHFLIFSWRFGELFLIFAPFSKLFFRCNSFFKYFLYRWRLIAGNNRIMVLSYNWNDIGPVFMLLQSYVCMLYVCIWMGLLYNQLARNSNKIFS